MAAGLTNTVNGAVKLRAEAPDRVLVNSTIPLGEFALRETETEPLASKLPAGQAGTGYLRERRSVNVELRFRHARFDK
jgi:hypothetical protein